MKTIVFCGGGTAGHVTPNLALCQQIRKSSNPVFANCKLCYVGSTTLDKQIVLPYLNNGTVDSYHQLTAHKLKRSLALSNLLLPLRLSQSVNQAKKLLQQLNADLVFSKGGYVGLPVVIAAKQLGIKSILHESDLSMGLANKLSLHFVDKALSAFDIGNKTTTVGMLLRDGIEHGNRKKGLQTMGFDGKKPILLVTGGSLGAAALNDAIQANVQLCKKFDVFVLSGKGKRLQTDLVHQTELVDDPSDLFAAADVCLTRAGSTTLCELTKAQLPFVCVPLVNDSRGEQTRNAKYFAEHCCGIVADQQGLQHSLPFAVGEAYTNRHQIRTFQKQMSDTIDGTNRCVQIIANLLSNK